MRDRHNRMKNSRHAAARLQSSHVNLLLFLLLFLFRDISRWFPLHSLSVDLNVAHICPRLTSYKHNLRFLRYLTIYSEQKIYVLIASYPLSFPEPLLAFRIALMKSYLDDLSIAHEYRKTCFCIVNRSTQRIEYQCI